MEAVSIALGRTRTGEPLLKLSTMRFHWSLRGCVFQLVVMATPLTPLESGVRETQLEGGTPKAYEGNAEIQVGETGKTIQAMGVSPEMPCFDMEAPCEGGSDLAHIDIICTGDELRVLTVGHPREVEAKSGGKPSSLGFSLEDLREAQGKDEELRFILDWLTNSVTPGEGELHGQSCDEVILAEQGAVHFNRWNLYQNEVASGDKKLPQHES